MKKVLAVIDMQNDFIDGALGSLTAGAIVPRVVRKIERYVKNGDEVVFTRDTHTRQYLSTLEGRHLPVTHCLKGSHGWQIADAAAAAADMKMCKIFDKNTFGSLELAKYLQKNGPYDEIELIGLVSSICVVSNALLLRAYLPETEITVDAACMAGVTEDDHQAAMSVMKMCHINVINGEK